MLLEGMLCKSDLVILLVWFGDSTGNWSCNSIDLQLHKLQLRKITAWLKYNKTHVFYKVFALGWGGFSSVSKFVYFTKTAIEMHFCNFVIPYLIKQQT